MVDPKVPEEQKKPDGVAAEATPAQSIGDAASTALAGGASGDAKSEVNVEKLNKELADKQAEIDRIQQKYEKDIDNLRSSLQADGAKSVKALENRLAQMQADYDAIATKDMDDAQRAVFDRKRAIERAEAAEARNSELETALNEQKQYSDTVNYFRSRGIPDNVLNFEGGVEELAASAWHYLEEKAEGKTSAEAKTKTKKDAKTAPAVLTDGAGAAAHKETMQDVITKYKVDGEHPEATERRIYEMIGNGELPASILPLGN